MKLQSDSIKTLLVGPAFPAVGGIATIVESLRGAAGACGNISFLNTAKRGSRIARAVSLFVTPLNIFVQAMLNRYYRVLMFAGAYKSFWEKCVWSLLARVAGSKVILMMVDGNFPEFYGKLSGAQRRIAQKLVNGLEFLLVQSPVWKEYYEGIFNKASIRVITGGVDSLFFTPSDEPKPETPIRILYVGWLIEAKGIMDLLNAAAFLKKQNIDYSLRIVGPAFGKEQFYEDQIERMGLASRVQMLGSIVNRNELKAQYQSSHIFAFPSHYEGFPLALMEAMSSGLPCVATSVGGIVDMLDHGRCGVLVPPKAPEVLAEEIINLVKKPELRSELGNRARQRVLEHHTLEKCTQDYMRVLCGAK